MSRGKKIALGILIAVVAAGITWYFVMRSRYLTVYADELIDNVFDEMYYSEMHPLLFRYTLTDMRNLKKFVRPSKTYYIDGGKLIMYRSSWDFHDKYSIRLSSVREQCDVSMVVAAFYETYTIKYYYDYYVEKKELIFQAFYIDENDEILRIKKDNVEAFLEEMGLPEDYLETQGKINLDDLLSHWFDMNNGLSRFSLDNLGDFTIEYEY